MNTKKTTTMENSMNMNDVPGEKRRKNKLNVDLLYDI
jgi:hypothetical protein